MSSMKKPELVQALKDLGETPPKEWTVLELHGRLSELRQEKGLPELETKKSRTPLRQMMVDLNKAQRLKADLVKYVSGALRVPLTGNETVKVLMQKGMEAVYQQAPASPQDPPSDSESMPACATRSCGRHSHLLCPVGDGHLLGERGFSPRLHRLANWLEETQEGDRHCHTPEGGSFLRKDAHREDQAEGHDRTIQDILRLRGAEPVLRSGDHEDLADAGLHSGRIEGGHGCPEGRATSQGPEVHQLGTDRAQLRSDGANAAVSLRHRDDLSGPEPSVDLEPDLSGPGRSETLKPGHE